MVRDLLPIGRMDTTARPAGSFSVPVPDTLNRLSERVIGCAIAVHRELGPGLLESVYDGAFCIELAHRQLQFLRQVPCPIEYRDRPVGQFRLDFLIEDALVVEIKSVQAIEYVFVAQMLTYLKATNRRLGLILNFGAPVLKNGIRRVIR